MQRTKKYEYSIQAYDNISSYIWFMYTDNTVFCEALFKGTGDHY